MAQARTAKAKVDGATVATQTANLTRHIAGLHGFTINFDCAELSAGNHTVGRTAVFLAIFFSPVSYFLFLRATRLAAGAGCCHSTDAGNAKRWASRRRCCRSPLRAPACHCCRCRTLRLKARHRAPPPACRCAWCPARRALPARGDDMRGLLRATSRPGYPLATRSVSPLKQAPSGACGTQGGPCVGV